MNTLQVRHSLTEFPHSARATIGDRAEELGPYQLLPRAMLPPAHRGYTLDRWLAGFNRPEQTIASGRSMSALRRAGNPILFGKPLDEPTLLGGSRRVPPPKSPRDIQAADAGDDGWKPTVMDFYVGANQVVVRCRVCPSTGAVRDLRVDLVPLGS